MQQHAEKSPFSIRNFDLCASGFAKTRIDSLAQEGLDRKKQLHFRKFQLIFYFSEKSTKILKFRKLQLILLIS